MDETDELNQPFTLSVYLTSPFVGSTDRVENFRTGTIDPEELEEMISELG